MPLSNNQILRLIAKAKAGDKRATERLLQRYDGYLAEISRRYHAPGLERSDLVQTARLSLLKAIQDFDPTRGMAFHNFLALAANRLVITEVHKAQCFKYTILNSAVSLEESAETEDNPHGTLLEVLRDHETNIENEVCDQLDRDWKRRRLLDAILPCLSPLQKAAVIAYLDNDGCLKKIGEEIAGLFRGKDATKAADNALTGARAKIKALVGSTPDVIDEILAEE